ncbi:MAG: protein-L-isoaspartate(D-aspartate) O-methyltransferase [Phycisphaerae bacterium]|nr:protein-L-isoaspartate(D-aspartate) O-methyltransferase [Phycisphaerae bacterium]
MASEEQKFVAARRNMIERHLRARGIRDPRVCEAFRLVPREWFVDDAYKSDAYVDSPLPIGNGQTISQPYIVALMLQELDVHPEHRVLDVGAGSGYQTALLSHLAAEVHGVERIETLADRAVKTLAKLNLTNVTIHVGDGSLGWPDHAPYDRIICGAAAPDVPPAWIEQLTDGGVIVTPAGPRDVQTLRRVEKHGTEIRRTELCGVRFVPLLGEQGWR